MSRKSHKNLLLSLVASVIVHFLLFFLAYILKSDREEEVYKVLFRPYRHAPAKPLYPVERPIIPRVAVEMLPEEGSPELPPEGLAAIGDTSRWEDELRKSAWKAIVLESLEEAIGSKIGPSLKLELGEEALSASDLITPYDLPSQEEFELVSIDDLNYGRYDATIIQDPGNKRNITGYLNMAIVYFQGLSLSNAGIDNLLRYMRDYTNIRAKIKGSRVQLSSRSIFSAPFIYMPGFVDSETPVLLSHVEIENLGDYLRDGGFLFADDLLGGGVYQSPFANQMKMYLKEVLKDSLGREPEFRKIPNDHPIYYAFYDFGNGPPIPTNTSSGVRPDIDRTSSAYLEGLWIGDRLAVIISGTGISAAWDPLFISGERFLQFGVNIIAYALTHAPSSVVKTRPVPAWVKRPPRVAKLEQKGENPFAGTGGYLALLRTPFHKTIEKDQFNVYLDGVNLDISELEDTSKGVMFSRLQPGDHVLRIEYGGKSKRLDLSLIDGEVLTVKFGIDKIFFANRFRLSADDSYFEYLDWIQRHADLKIAGIYEDYQQPPDARPRETEDPVYTDR